MTFDARPGQVTGFPGPNGAGKTSTLRILLGLDRRQCGTALIRGRPYRTLDRPLMTVGALLDRSGAHRTRTARAHLRWVAASHGLPHTRVDEVLEMVGLAGVARRRAGRFSLGMSRRLGLATARSAALWSWSWTNRSTASTRPGSAGCADASDTARRRAARSCCPAT